MKFGEFIAAITHELLWDEDFFTTFSISTISTADWPEGFVRATAERYFEYRETNGHLFAQHKLLEASHKLKALYLPDIPKDESVLRPLYWEKLKIHRAESLAMRMISKPEQADELIKSYQSGTTDGLVIEPLSKVLSGYLEESVKRRLDGTAFVSLPDYPLLSDMIGGFNPGRITILLADTGFGKTNLGINLALSASKTMATLYLNMEMILHDFAERVAALLSKSTYRQMLDGSFDAEFLTYRGRSHNIFISDGRDLSIQQIKSAIRNLCERSSLRFVVVDYDQKLILEIDRNTQEWKALQNAIIALESISKELGVHCLILAQQNAEGAISGSRRATFSASTVLRFFHDESVGDVIQAIKNRFGKRNAAIRVNYKPEQVTIEEIEKTIISQKRRAIPE